MDAFVLVGILTVLSLIAQRDRAPLRGVAARALRALLPAWRFFDRVDDAPASLSYRLVREDGRGGAFCPLALPVRTRSLGSLLLQPSGNLRLAYYAMLAQLLSDLTELPADDHEAAERLVSYQLIEDLVRAHVPAHERTPGTHFQFELRSCDREGREEVLMRSKIAPV